MEAFDGYYRPVNVKQLVMISVPEAATRVAMLERGEADIIYNVPGELINKVGKLPGVTLAPVLSGSFFIEFPGLPGPQEPVPRQARARGGEPGHRPARHEPGGDGRDGQGDGQLDQRRRPVRDRVARVPAQRGEGQAAPARGGLSERVRRGLGHAAARVLLAGRAHHRAAPRGRHPRPAPDHGARHLLPAAAGRAQGVSRHPDHPARRPDRGKLVVLVRRPLQVRRLQLARPHLREGPRRQVRPVRAVDQPGRAQEARRGDPARRSWRTTTSCPCSGTRSSTRSAPGSWRRSGRTSSRPSPPATPIRGRT